MAATKLEGYKSVAVVKFPGINREYYYALYDDFKSGDRVLVSGAADECPTIVRVLTAREAAEECKVNIISEVICKVDLEKYEERLSAREKKKKLKAEMEKRKKEIQKMKDDEYYALMDAEFASMLKVYRELSV